jgi:hypothetical protein
MENQSNRDRRPIRWDMRLWSVLGCGIIGAVLGVVVGVFGFGLNLFDWWQETMTIGALVGAAFGLLFPRVGAIVSNGLLIFTD